MIVTVRLFAALRELRGCEELRCPIEPGATPQSLFVGLFGEGPLARLPVAYAVNAAYARGDQALRDGDEVAFLPPLGGG